MTRTLELVAYASQQLGPRIRQNDSFYHGTNFAAIADGAGDAPEVRAAADAAVEFYADLARDAAQVVTGRVARALLNAPEKIARRLRLLGLETASTACVVVLDDDDLLWVSSIGDSRALLLRAGSIVHTNTLHNRRAQILLEVPNADPPSSSSAHLTRYLAADRVDAPDLAVIAAVQGDVVVLVSDGVDNAIGIGGICDAIRASGGDAADAELRIARAVVEAGIEDNATCIVAAIVARTE